MHLSLSCPTHPRLGNRWGFVTKVCPQGRGICTTTLKSVEHYFECFSLVILKLYKGTHSFKWTETKLVTIFSPIFQTTIRLVILKLYKGTHSFKWTETKLVTIFSPIFQTTIRMKFLHFPTSYQGNNRGFIGDL